MNRTHRTFPNTFNSVRHNSSEQTRTNPIGVFGCSVGGHEPFHVGLPICLRSIMRSGGLATEISGKKPLPWRTGRCCDRRGRLPNLALCWVKQGGARVRCPFRYESGTGMWWGSYSHGWPAASRHGSASELSLCWCSACSVDLPALVPVTALFFGRPSFECHADFPRTAT